MPSTGRAMAKEKSSSSKNSRHRALYLYTVLLWHGHVCALNPYGAIKLAAFCFWRCVCVCVINYFIQLHGSRQLLVFLLYLTYFCPRPAKPGGVLAQEWGTPSLFSPSSPGENTNTRQRKRKKKQKKENNQKNRTKPSDQGNERQRSKAQFLGGPARPPPPPPPPPW